MAKPKKLDTSKIGGTTKPSASLLAAVSKAATSSSTEEESTVQPDSADEKEKEEQLPVKAKKTRKRKKKEIDIERADIPSPEITVPSKPPASLSEIGVRPSVAEKLKKAGVTTTGVLATMSAKQLADLVSGVGETIAKRLVNSARDYHGLGLKRATLVRAQHKSRKKISTGLKGLDGILDGGVETGVITEFYGAFKSGKTQLCHQLSILVQRPESEGGLGKACAWIDTEGTWYPGRPIAIAERFGMDPDKVLDNIYIARSYNSEEQMALTNEVLENIEELNIGLIIVDSLIAHFRGEYIGRGTLAVRQQTIGNYLELLQRPISIAQVAVVVTNQVSSSPDPYAVGGPEQATGGNIVSHATGHRINLRGKSQSVTAKIIDSPILKQDKCDFKITEGGLEDI